MSLPCIKQLTTVNFDKMTNKKNDYLVIHWVAAVSTAKNNADYFQNTYRGASAHYFVDGKDLANCVYQIVSELNAAWHVGATTYKHPSCRNTNSIGIEICCIKDANGGTIMDPLAIERAAELARSICQMWSIPRERVLRHFDVTGKACPVPFNRDNSAWEAFKDKIFNANNVQINNPDNSSNDGSNNNGLQTNGKENMTGIENANLFLQKIGKGGNDADWSKYNQDQVIALANEWNERGDKAGKYDSVAAELTSCKIDLEASRQARQTGNSTITPTKTVAGKLLNLKRLRIDTSTNNMVAEYE